MEYPSFYASQPIPSAAFGAVPNQLTASSSQGAIPSSWSQAGGLNNATTLLGLKLPPNALKVIAQSQASGRFPALFNPPPANTQPFPSHVAKSIATAKRRPTVRSHSQPNMLRSGHASAYARAGGVPVAKPVPQPLDAAHYQPPPVKARARRVRLAAKSKARATAAPMVVNGPESPFTPTLSGSILAQTASLTAMQPGTVAAPTAPPTDSARPAPTLFWGDRTKSLSMPTLQAGPSSQLERAQAISRLPGLGGIPIKLIHTVLRRIEGRSDSLVEDDAGTSRAWGSDNSQSTIDENSLPPVMETSTTEAPELPHPAAISEFIPLVEQQYEPFLPAGQPESGPTTEAWDWMTTLDFLLEATAPLMESPTVEVPTMEQQTTAELPAAEPERQPLTSLTIEESEGPTPIEEGSRITVVLDEESAEEEPSAALEYLLDLEHSAAVEAARSETRLSPPTREEIERSLCPLPNDPGQSTEFGCGTDISGAGMGELRKFVARLQEDEWKGFIDFSFLVKA